jgi:HK97 family phage major capsid protein
MEYSDINSKVDQMSSELAHVKAEQACFAALMESKERPQFEQKLACVEGQHNALSQRISHLEAERNRGFLKGSNASALLEMKSALETFIRMGGHDGSLEVKELSTERGGDGLIPRYIHDKIVQQLGGQNSIRSLCNIIQIQSDSIDILVEKKEADAGWIGEAEERGETGSPEIFKMTIPTHELYARPKVTQKLLDDSSVDLERWVIEKVTQQMVSKENQAFLNGSGLKMPKGILSYPFADESSSWGQFQSFSIPREKLSESVAMSNALTDMVYSLKPGYLNGAVWVMSRQMLSTLRKLREEGSGRYLWQPALLADQPSTLLGYPVVTVDDMPKIEEGKPMTQVLFGNLKQTYQIADRTSLSLLRDPYSSKPFVEFYITRRVGGDVVCFDSLKGLTIR